MNLNKLIVSCGVISALTFGVLGNNAYAEEVQKSNDAINVIEHVPTDLLLTQTLDYTGEAVTSFVYKGSTDLSFFIKNNGQNKMGYSVKGPNKEPIVGGYIKPGEQKLMLQMCGMLYLHYRWEHIKFTFQMMMDLQDNSKLR